jgi:hypothetical protein
MHQVLGILFFLTLACNCNFHICYFHCFVHLFIPEQSNFDSCIVTSEFPDGVCSKGKKIKIK